MAPTLTDPGLQPQGTENEATFNSGRVMILCFDGTGCKQEAEQSYVRSIENLHHGYYSCLIRILTSSIYFVLSQRTNTRNKLFTIRFFSKRPSPSSQPILLLAWNRLL